MDRWQAARFRSLGRAVAARPFPFLLTLLVIGLLGFGLFEAHIEEDVEKLWVNKGTRLDDEKAFYDEMFGGTDRFMMVTFTDARVRRGDPASNVLSEAALREVMRMDASLLDMGPHVDPKGECFLKDETQCAAAALTCEWHDQGRGVCMEADPFGLKPSGAQRAGVTVERHNVRWGMRELCLEAEMPAGMPTRSTCSNQLTPLDCFAEFPASHNHGIIRAMGWAAAHPISVADDARGRAVAGTCAMWMGGPLPKGYTMGGVRFADPANRTDVVGVAAWNLLYPLVHPKGLVRKWEYIMQHPTSGPIFRAQGYPEALTEADAEGILEAWEATAYTHIRSQEPTYTATQLSWLNQWAFEEIVLEAARRDKHLIMVGFALMQCVCWAMVFSTDVVQTRTQLVGGGMVLCVMVAVVGALGFSALCGVPFNGLSLQVLPYVAMGLGIDDAFVLLHYFDPTPGASLDARVAEAFASAGPSITATSLVNLAVFFIGSAIPVNAVIAFALQSGIAVVFNYLCVLLAFGAILSIDGRRIDAGRVDGLFCIRRGRGCCGFDRCGTAPAAGAVARRGAWTAAASRCVDRFYVPLVTRPGGQVVVGLLTCALLGASVSAVGRLELGLSASEFVLDGSVEQRFLANMEDYFETASSYMVGRPDDWADPAKQAELYYLVGFRLNHPNNTFGIPGGEVRSQDPGFPTGPPSWVMNFRAFALGVGAGAPGNDATACNASDATWQQMTLGGLMAPPQCIVDPVKYHDLLGVWLGETGCPAAAGWCPPLLSLTMPTGLPAHGSGSPWRGDIKVATEGGRVSGVRIFRVTLMNVIAGYGKDVAASVDAMTETRGLLDATGLNVYAYGMTYSMNEQYVHSFDNLRLVLGVGVGAALVVLSVVLGSAQLAVLLTAAISASEVSIVAMMVVFGLKLNGISVLSIIFGVALNIEQSIHLARSFLIQVGDHPARTAAAVREMLVPVFAGALTTFVAVIPLAWSDIVFFKEYFFEMYSAMLVLSLFHAFGIVPVLLCLLGPDGIRDAAPALPRAEPASPERVATFDAVGAAPRPGCPIRGGVAAALDPRARPAALPVAEGDVELTEQPRPLPGFGRVPVARPAADDAASRMEEGCRPPTPSQSP